MSRIQTGWVDFSGHQSHSHLGCLLDQESDQVSLGGFRLRRRSHVVRKDEDRTWSISQTTTLPNTSPVWFFFTLPKVGIPRRREQSFFMLTSLTQQKLLQQRKRISTLLPSEQNRDPTLIDRKQGGREHERSQILKNLESISSHFRSPA